MTKVPKNKYLQKLEQGLDLFAKLINCGQNLLDSIPSRFKSKTEIIRQISQLILRANLTLQPTKKRFKVHNQLNRGYVVYLVNKLKEMWKLLETAGLTEVQVSELDIEGPNSQEEKALRRYEKVLEQKRLIEL